MPAPHGLLFVNILLKKETMKNYLLMMPLAVLLACNSGARQEEKKDSAANTEQSTSKHEDFIIGMVTANQEIIQLGRLAVVRAEQERMRRLGDTLVSKYSAANARLEQLAAKGNVTLPGDTLQPSRAVVSLTNIKDTREFERNWLQEVIAAQKDISYRYKQAVASKDPEISSLAKEMADFTEAQLDEASHIQEDMRKLINKTAKGADM